MSTFLTMFLLDSHQPMFLLVGMDLDTDFIRASDGALRQVLRACNLYLIPPFMTVALFYGIARGFLDNGMTRIDMSPIIKAVFLYFVLFFYSDFMDLIGGLIGAFSSLVAPRNPGALAAALQTLTNPSAAPMTPETGVNTGNFMNDSITDLSKAFDKLTSFSFMNLVTEFFTTTTVALIRQVLVIIRQYIIAFLYVCGPIAICLSILPPFAQLGKQWLQNFMAVNMWSLTYSLLDLIYDNYAATRPATGNILLPAGATPGDAANDMVYLVNSIGFVIIYISVPWLTSMIIGSTAVQSFAGMFAGTVASAAGSAAGVAFPSAAGGGATGALGRSMGFGSSGGGGGGGGGSSSGGVASSGPADVPTTSSSASASLPTVTLSEALTPTYQQQPSGLYTRS